MGSGGHMRLAALNYHFVPTEIMRALFRRLCDSYVNIINHFSELLLRNAKEKGLYFFRLKGLLHTICFLQTSPFEFASCIISEKFRALHFAPVE